MKKHISITITLLALVGIISLMLFSCSVLPKNEESGLVRFEVGGGVRASAWHADEESYSLMVSVKKCKGRVVYDRKVIELYRMGEGFISESVELEVGTFELTEYLIVDSKRQVVYAAPIEGSKKASLVNNPLPLKFCVCKDDTTTIRPEVLRVEGAMPEDFGYKGVSFEVVGEWILGFWVISLAHAPHTNVTEINANGHFYQFFNYDGSGGIREEGTWSLEGNVLTMNGTSVTIDKVSDDEIFIVDDDETLYRKGTEPHGDVFDQIEEAPGLSVDIWTDGDILPMDLKLYSFTAYLNGKYEVEWEGADIAIVAYRSDDEKTLVFDTEDEMIPPPRTVSLESGETIYIIADAAYDEGGYYRIMVQYVGP